MCFFPKAFEKSSNGQSQNNTGTRSGQVAQACSLRPQLGETGFLRAPENLYPHLSATKFEPPKPFKEVERSGQPFCDEKSASREGGRGPLAQRAAPKGQKSNLAMT